MRLRTLHLAQLVLLLSSLGAAKSDVRPAGDFTFRGNYITAVLFQRCVDASVENARQSLNGPRVRATASIDLPSSALATLNDIWTMRPPSAQTASLHTVTGLARA